MITRKQFTETENPHEFGNKIVECKSLQSAKNKITRMLKGK